MKARIIGSVWLFLMGIWGMIFSLIIIFRLIFDVQPRSNSVSSAFSGQQWDIGLPIRLIIWKIHLDTHLQYVGLTSGWAMDVPKDILTAARYELGTRPGDVGSAVIDGHFGLQNGIPAIFDLLHTLHEGDEVDIEDASGIKIVFIVREVQLYDAKADATDIFISHDGKAHLNLITCGGIRNPDVRTYSKRIVVFTDIQ